MGDSKVCPCCGKEINLEDYCRDCFKSPDEAAAKKPPLAAELTGADGFLYSIETLWVRIGRDPSNQIVLDQDRYSSRYHAWVTFENDKFYLEDLGSTNGTMLNGDLVESREALSSGDKIKIGETEFTFRLLDGPNAGQKI